MPKKKGRADLKPGGFLREKLTPEQEALARKAWACIRDAGLFHSFEQFEASLLRGTHPDRELGLWLLIGEQYAAYVRANPQTDRKAILLELILYTTKTKKDRQTIRKRVGPR